MWAAAEYEADAEREREKAEQAARPLTVGKIALGVFLGNLAMSALGAAVYLLLHAVS